MREVPASAVYCDTHGTGKDDVVSSPTARLVRITAVLQLPGRASMGACQWLQLAAV